MIATTDINMIAQSVRMDGMVRQIQPKTQKVEPAEKSEQARNDPASADSNPRGLLQPPYDPDAPTGPPPAFEANVLEAEALKRRHPEINLLEAERRDAPPAREENEVDVTR